MTDNENQYYQLPANSQQTIQRMGWALAVFFTLLLIVAGLVVMNAQSIAKSIPFSAEKRFVKPYEEAIRKWYPGQSNAEIDHYLQTLAEQLTNGMDLPDGVSIEVHYVDAEIVNAFATLGGHIFIFKGLLDEMPDENSLAMVLAHEIAHIKHRDPAAAMGRGFAIQLVYGFITNDYSNSADLISTSGEVGMSFFSREQEKEADLIALSALNAHYGHVAGYDDFFQLMQTELEEENLSEMPEWLSSHPDLEKRIDYLNQAVAERNFAVGNRQAIPEHIIQAAKTASDIEE